MVTHPLNPLAGLIHPHTHHMNIFLSLIVSAQKTALTETIAVMALSRIIFYVLGCLCLVAMVACRPQSTIDSQVIFSRLIEMASGNKTSPLFVLLLGPIGPRQQQWNSTALQRLQQLSRRKRDVTWRTNVVEPPAIRDDGKLRSEQVKNLIAASKNV